MRLTRFIKNQTFILFFSSILGVGLGLCSSILNTRFLTPEEYGNYRYVYNIISFIASLLLFGYFVSGCRLLAISNDKKRISQINGAMVLILLATIVVMILSMIFSFWIQSKSSNQSVAPLFLISIPVCGAPLILNYINTTFQGENRIIELSVARLLPYMLYLPLGYYWYTHYGSNASTLMLLQNGCSIVVLTSLIIYIKPTFQGLKPIFKQLHKENREYGLHVYVGSVLAVSLGYVSGITLGIFEGNNINVAYYTLALTIATPLTMLPSIVGTTHFKEFATNNSIKPVVIRNTIIVSVLSLIAFIIMIIPVVKFIYTEAYDCVGYYSCFLAVAMSFHGFGDMFNRFLGAHGKGKPIRNSAIITGVIQCLGSVFLVYFMGIWGAILTKFISSFIYFSLMLFYYNKIKRDLVDISN